jgi:hypothetical protein
MITPHASVSRRMRGGAWRTFHEFSEDDAHLDRRGDAAVTDAFDALVTGPEDRRARVVTPVRENQRRGCMISAGVLTSAKVSWRRRMIRGRRIQR